MSSCLPAVPSLGFGSLLGELDVSAFLITLSLCLQKQGYQGFPGGSVGKESASNAGDPGLIPGSGRSPGEGIGYPFQYSWASLVTQLVKNPPAMR